MQNIKMYNI